MIPKMIAYECSRCRAQVESPSELAGKPEACPNCGTLIIVAPLPIGGWLNLLAISLVLSLVILAFSMVVSIIVCAMPDRYQDGPIILKIVDLFQSVVLFALVLYVTVMFYQCRRAARGLIIALNTMVLLIGLTLLVYQMAHNHTPGDPSTAGLCWPVIWTGYLLVSERVKRTFVLPGWWLFYSRSNRVLCPTSTWKGTQQPRTILTNEEFREHDT